MIAISVLRRLVPLCDSVQLAKIIAKGALGLCCAYEKIQPRALIHLVIESLFDGVRLRYMVTGSCSRQYFLTSRVEVFRDLLTNIFLGPDFPQRLDGVVFSVLAQKPPGAQCFVPVSYAVCTIQAYAFDLNLRMKNAHGKMMTGTTTWTATGMIQLQATVRG